MINYYEKIKAEPGIFNQLVCKELLFVHYKCPLEIGKHDKWSQHNYILYIVTGKKGYHTPNRSLIFKSGEAVFVKKGGSIIEKFFEGEMLCIMTFFIPDSYLRSFMREHISLMRQNSMGSAENDQLIPLHVNEMMAAYFNSMMPYFSSETKPSEDLLELKFRELLLNILADPNNHELNAYLQELALSETDSLQQIMEANCIYNLSLEDYAKLCNLSVSSFKRHFFETYKTTPGQWLLKRKLEHAYKLLITSSKPITDISFESGFENSTHFSHVFKKHFGSSPIKYRNQFISQEHP
ncbi:MAG TPA: helix-turn-helix transcriptional regulator [Chitinophagaceae bacterium]|jgi:AraC-like DNA-binding protein|nr:helix-turn-helix transcriptional regulator [Chitinophagaceae bacterium]